MFKKKIAFTALLLLGLRCDIYAQAEIGRSARQKVELKLADVIEITFSNSDMKTGPLVQLSFVTVADYFDGVESLPQKLKVRSNRGFTVSVRTASEAMTYSGYAGKKNNIEVPEALNIRVPVNHTGGNIAHPFSENSYNNLSGRDRVLIDGCNRGNDQSFSVQYKAKPKVAYSPGAYTVDVIYTASRI